MSKIEQSSRPDLAFHDRAPSTVTFRVQKGETGAPTVGSEIEIPAFHLFAVSTATEASAEAREPITPRNAEQAVHEYPVIAKTKKTLCLGKTFPLLTLGTDNPVPGPQVLSEISGLKKLREWGIDVPIIDGWVNGDEIPTTTPAKETYERLFPAEKTKSDKTAREKHIERLQAAESYNIEMMSAPLLTPEDAALFAEASYTFSLAAVKAIEESKDGKNPTDCIADKSFFPEGSAEHRLLSKPERGTDPQYMVKTSRLLTLYNELTKSKPEIQLEPVAKAAGQEHWLRINADHKNSSQLNFGIPMSTFATAHESADSLEDWWKDAREPTAMSFHSLRKSKIDSWLKQSGLTAVATDQEVRAFFIHFTIYFYVIAHAVNQVVASEKLQSLNAEKVVSIAMAVSTRTKDEWGILIKTGVRDSLRGISATSSRAALRTWWKTGDNKETHLTALRKICELAMNPDDSKAVLSHSQMLVTHEAPKIFEVDTARYAGENDGTYGFGYAAKPPAQTPWQIHSPTHNPTPLFYIQETGTAKNRAALVFEIRAGKAINTFNRADSHSSFKGPARTLDAVQKRVADFVKLLYKYQ